jgi:phosphonate transport system substrate-binding protein
MLQKIVSLLIIFALSVVAGCAKEEEPTKISLKERGNIPTEQNDKGKHLRFAVGGMVTPKEGLSYYKHFLDYIGEQIGEHVDFVDREDYAEINNMLEGGNLDLAFVCSGPYVDGHAEFGLELLAAPQAYGESEYYSYIIVHKNSPIKKFEELRGKRFAFTDPLSNTGKLVPTYMLAKMNETPDTFFQKYVFVNSHDNAIKAVAQGLVDGAAVDSLIWEYLNRTGGEFTSNTTIILKSPPYGIPPVVVPITMDPQLKEQLKQIFLTAHTNAKGRKILSKMMIDKFVVVDDQAYDSVREMKSWLTSQNKKP